jgi:toxin ParE1/3/4
MKVRYNSQAAHDIDEILSYLAKQNPAAAARQLSRFEAAIRRISHHPYIGISVRKELRRIVVGKYLIIYRVGAEMITIEYIRHSARKRPWEEERI